VLSLTRADKQTVSEVIEYAKKNKINLNQTERIFMGKAKPPGDNPRYVCLLKAGKRQYRLVFTHLEQPRGWTRHLSISSPDGKAIALDDLNAFLKLFGFQTQVASLDEGQQGFLYVYAESNGALNCTEFIETSEDIGPLRVLSKEGANSYMLEG
jgi:hypothetical protein